jgi:hypothetical protein
VSTISGNRVRLEPAVNFGEGWSVTIGIRHADGSHAVMQPIAMPTMMHYPSGVFQSAPVPSFHLAGDTGQALLDALWAQGVRPSSGVQAGADPKGQIEAMTNHIADLRGILKRVVPPGKTGDTPTEAGAQSW